MSSVLVIGASVLKSAMSLAAFSFACSGVSCSASVAFFFAVFVCVTAGLTVAGSTLVSSALKAGANHEQWPKQMIVKVSRAAERVGLFTKQCLAAAARGEKLNLGLQP